MLLKEKRAAVPALFLKIRKSLRPMRAQDGAQKRTPKKRPCDEERAMIPKINEISRSEMPRFKANASEPTKLKGWARDWPARLEWSFEDFRSLYGEIRAPFKGSGKLKDYNRSNEPLIRLADYIDFMIGDRKLDPFIDLKTHISGWRFRESAPELLDDIKVPPCFQNHFLDKLGKNPNGFEATSIFIGQESVITELQKHHSGVCAWLANVRGRLKIRRTSKGAVQNLEGPIDLFDEGKGQDLVQSELDIQEALIDSGDMLFIPPGFAYQIKYEENSIGVFSKYLSENFKVTFEKKLLDDLFTDLELE